MSSSDTKDSASKKNETSKPSKTAEKKIQLKKKTPKELEEMATAIQGARVTSCESTDDTEPRPPTSCPSESSMQKLNSELKKVPIVKAFNSAERHLEN